MKIGIIIVKLREYHGISTRELATRAKVSRGMVRMIEAKNYLPKHIKIVDKIAEALNTDYYSLMSGKLPDLATIELIHKAENHDVYNVEKVWDDERAWALKLQQLCIPWNKEIVNRLLANNYVRRTTQKKCA